MNVTDEPKFHDEPGHGGPGLPGGAETGEPHVPSETGGAVASSAREGSSGGQQLGLVDYSEIKSQIVHMHFLMSFSLRFNLLV